MEARKRFFYNGIMLTLVGLAIRTVSLFFNAFVTRAVGSEAVGLYTLIMTVYGFAVTLATSGISLTVTRLVAAAQGEGRDDEVGSILSGAVAYTLAFSLLATAVLYMGAEPIAAKMLGDGRAAVSLRILAPSLIPLSMISVFSGYFIGVRRVACNATVQILGQAFKISATVWLVLRAIPMDARDAAVSLSLGTTLTEVLCFVVVFIEFVIERKGIRKPSSPAVRPVAKMAIPLAVSAYIRQALLTLEHVLIPHRLQRYGKTLSESLSAYGILHGMALPTVLYPMVILSSFSGLLVPEFAEREAKGEAESMRRLASRTFEATMTYATAAAVMLLIFSEELGYVIYSSGDAGRFIAVLAPIVPIMYLDHVTDSMLKGIGEQVYSMWVNITDSLLSVALIWILLPKMGIMGYAVCIIAMEAYNFILSGARLFSKIRFRISIRRSFVYPAFSSFVAALLTKRIFISAGASTEWLWLVLEMIFTVCILTAVYKALCIWQERKRLSQSCDN
ncbi:MAG: hypothetical protein E7617_07625 [Ruminococcaceae bacterium]|nr:hypothetical protein [Oscillospiraceae bacterium]